MWESLQLVFFPQRERIYTGEKPCECWACGKAFSKTFSLRARCNRVAAKVLTLNSPGFHLGDSIWGPVQIPGVPLETGEEPLLATLKCCGRIKVSTMNSSWNSETWVFTSGTAPSPTDLEGKPSMFFFSSSTSQLYVMVGDRYHGKNKIIVTIIHLVTGKWGKARRTQKWIKRTFLYKPHEGYSPSFAQTPDQPAEEFCNLSRHCLLLQSWVFTINMSLEVNATDNCKKTFEYSCCLCLGCPHLTILDLSVLPLFVIHLFP